MSFGIFGVESAFGKENNAPENLAKAGIKQAVSWYNDVVPKDMRKSVTSPDPMSKYYTYGVQGNENSVGYTQIRWDELSNKEIELLAKLDVTSNADFLNPKKVGAATVAILANRYNMQLSPSQKKNMWDHLPSKWNTSSKYTTRIKNTKNKYLTVKQLDKLKKGGQVDIDMNNVMYKNYVNGVYNNTSMEEEALNVYDKLNRIHYKDAKASNMSPANYILTHIVEQS